MRTLILLELKKFTLQKVNWVVFGILITLLIGFIAPKIQQDRSMGMYHQQALSTNLESSTQSVSFFREELKNYPGNQALIYHIEDTNLDIEALTHMVEAYEQKDWNTYLTYSIQLDQTELTATKAGRRSGPDIYALQDNIDLSTLLLQRNIKPISTSTSMESVNFLILLLQNKLILLFLFVVVLMSSHFISSDFEKETYKLLYTQPISKFKILVSKFSAACIINMTWLITLIGGSSLILGLMNGFGDLNYPTKLYQNGELAYSTAGHYIGIGWVIFLFLVLICILLTFLLSTICHQTLTTLICSTLIIFMPLLLIKNEAFLPVAKYVPFTFEEVGSILSGTHPLKTIDYNTAWMPLSITLILLSILLILIFQKRKLA
ncbi:MAG: ABC transporter permease [Turicibacter sp.]